MKKCNYKKPTIEPCTIEIEKILAGNSKKVKVNTTIAEEWTQEEINAEFEWNN